MQKNKLIIVLCLGGALIGLTMLLLSWGLSYPLSMDSPYDFVFNHISLLYWLSLPVLYVSLYIMATKLKSNGSRLIVIFSIVIVMHSLKYFYSMIPGSDSHYVRGLTESFFKTGSLDTSQRGHYYLQWPLFFVLEKMAYLVLGLELVHLEFIFYTVISFLFVAALYFYASKFDKNNAYMAVIGFFIIVQYLFEFQFVPVFLAIGLLLVLFMLQTRAPGRSNVALILIIFTSLTMMHAYVVVFFMLYTLAMFLLKRRQRFLRLFLYELCIYSVVLINFAQPFFVQRVRDLLNIFSFGYGALVTRTLGGGWAAPPTSITIVSQMLSRAVTIGTIMMLGIGFTLLLIRRKLRDTDRAILLSGVVYAAVGTVIFIVGHRAFILIAMIMSLGILYPSKRLAKYLKVILLAFLLLFTFVQVSLSFNDAQTMFQTKVEYQSSNFLIDNVNLTNPIVILSHYRVFRYISTKGGGYAIYEHDLSESFPENMEISDLIFYTVGLGKSFLKLNLSESMPLEIESRFNIVFDSGSSYIAIRPNA